MSKTKTMRIAVIAAIMSLLLALATLAITVPARAAKEAGANETLALGRAWIPANADKLRIELTPFAHVGADGTGETDIANSGEMKSKIFLTVPEVANSINPSHIRTEPAYNALLLYFNDTDYANINTVPVDTSLTIKAGFGYTANDGKTYETQEDVTYYFAGNGLWSAKQPQTFEPGKATSANQLFVKTTPFAHVGTADSGETDIANYNDMKDKISVTIPDSTVHNPSHIRTERASGGLKLYFNNSGDYAATQKMPVNSVLTIKKDFAYLAYDGNIYKTDKDVSYIYAGSGVWSRGEVETITFGNVTNKGQLLISFTPFSHVGAPGSAETDIANYSDMKEYVQIKTPDGKAVYPSHIRTECVSDNREAAGLKIYFNDTDYQNVNTVPAGSVLTVKGGFVFAAYDAKAYTLANDFVRIFNGSEWVEQATDFELALNEIGIPQYAEFEPAATFSPTGTYAVLSYEIANTDIVEMKNGKLIAKAVGETNVTVKLQGADTKTMKVTVTQSEKNLVISNDRVFYVGEGENFDITKVKVRVNYGEGSDGKTYYSAEYALNENNAMFSLPTATGAQNMPVKVTLEVNGITVTDTVNVKVDVQPNREVVIANFALWATEKHTVGIYFNGTFGNTANVFMKDLTPEQRATVVNFIEFERGGVKGAVLNEGDHTPNYLTHILVTSFTFNGQQISAFEQGDVITLKKGLTFWQWFGDKDDWNVPVGEGDYVKVGELKHDIKIKYNGDKFSWHIDPVSGAVKEETVTVGLGKTHASNVEITPVYATHGEWYFTVADSAIAKVSTSGLISGLKIGSTKVTATLKDVDGKVIDEAEFTVVVADVEKEIKITSEKPVNIALGAELDVAALAENFGLKGVVIMASGAEGEAVDLTKARVTGYDPEKNGEQTLTFRVSVNGVSVSGTFVITVGDGGGNGGGEEGCGCGSSVAGVASLAFGAAILAVALAITMRRKKA